MSNGFNGFCSGRCATCNAPQCAYTERWRVPPDIDVISPAAVAVASRWSDKVPGAVGQEPAFRNFGWARMALAIIERI
jgi:hypothetical protein